MPVINTWVNQDAKGMVPVRNLCGVLFSQDDRANLLGVRITDGGEPVVLSGTVTGYVIRPDGETIEITGSISGNAASIVLTANCYDLIGNISIAIKIDDVTIGAFIARVTRSMTDDLIQEVGL